MSIFPSFQPGAFRRGLRHAGLTHGEFRVAVELAEHSGAHRSVVWPSVATLAEVCGMTERGIQRALENLVTKGVVACESRTKGGRGQTNHWRLLVKTPNHRSELDTTETPNGGSGFDALQTPNDGSGFAPETPNGGAAKPRTKLQKTPNGGSPEVVRTSKREGARARESVTDRPGHTRNGADAPPPQCSKHPDGPDHANDCGPCGAVRRHQSKQAERERQDSAQRQRERDVWERGTSPCHLCPDNGMVFRPGPHGERDPRKGALYVKCPHNARDYRQILADHARHVAQAEAQKKPHNTRNAVETW